MLKPKAEVGSWVSEAAREKFMAAYERAFALWPQPLEEFDIETATATTRVHAYRPHPGGAPVVLLTGAGFNASGWYPHVAALARRVLDAGADRVDFGTPHGLTDAEGVALLGTRVLPQLRPGG